MTTPTVELARLPTPVEHLDRISTETGVGIWVKRDDLTGMGLSGNKVRKLEFLLGDALFLGAKRVATCGGIQSNHARATAIAARKLGLDSRLYLRGTPPVRAEGNVLLDRLVGAEIRFVTREEYDRIDEIMAADAAADASLTYPIPEGGSNALGALGYAKAVEEILETERELGFTFDAVVHATGSGGTTAGLVLGRLLHGLEARICGVNVCDDAAFFTGKIARILTEAAQRYCPGVALPPGGIEILDGHEGPAYAVPDHAQLETIRRVALAEGVFLDPVYTGKAFHGMLAETAPGGRLADCRRLLFVHTGGLFGLFPQADLLLGGQT